MGFSVAGTGLGKWIAEKVHKNKIRVLQDVIDRLNKALDTIAETENVCLKYAARELEKSREYGGIYESIHLERKEIYERHAKGHVAMRPTLVAELALFQNLKKIEIEALKNGDFTTQNTLTRQLCLLF